jgi:hypothetical protein
MSLAPASPFDDLESANPRALILDQLNLLLCQQKVECNLAVQNAPKIGTVKQNNSLVVSSSHAIKTIL